MTDALTTAELAEAELAEAEEAYRQALPEGDLQELDLSVLDRTGVPTVAMSLSAGGITSAATGYGATPAQARVGALGELAEGLFPELAASQCEVLTASFDDLCRQQGAEAVCDPLTLTLPAGSGYSPSDRLVWGPALRWRTGETVWVPIEFLASERSTLDRRFPHHRWITTPITNGLGAGVDLERAVCHGLLEILQRDGDTVSFRALDQGVVLDVSGAQDPVIDQTVERLAEVGISPRVKYATGELVSVVYCVGDSPGMTEPEPIALSAIGEAAHPDPVVAVRKALLEFAASRARRIFSFGSIENLSTHFPLYAEGVIRAGVSGQDEPRALEAMIQWCRMGAPELRAVLDPIFRHVRTVDLDDVEVAVPPPSTTPLLDHLLGLLSDFDVLVMPGSEGPGSPVRTAKVIVPGLEVETLSYLRIGERVTRRLLDRGSPLVVQDPAAGGDLAPIRLTDEATEKLGGPAWLDRAEVDRVLGRLYPLYREPGRHSASLSLLTGTAD